MREESHERSHTGAHLGSCMGGRRVWWPSNISYVRFTLRSVSSRMDFFATASVDSASSSIPLISPSLAAASGGAIVSFFFLSPLP
jgi:hypothetical protein